MRIGEVAEQAGVSVRALRYYDELGLVAARRTSGGQRRYPASTVDRVRFIQLLYSAGLTSRAILQILPFLDTGIATPEMTRRLADERDRMQAQIEGLARARDRLDELLRLATTYTPSSPARCTQSQIVIRAGVE